MIMCRLPTPPNIHSVLVANERICTYATGGFAGSDLQVSQCPTTPSASTTGPINTACIAAYQTFHMTPSASGLYLENVWLWTADHDIEDPAGPLP